MRSIRLAGIFLVLAALALGGVRAYAGGGEEAAAAYAERARLMQAILDLARLRIEARIDQADTLRQMGRFEEALALYGTVDALYEQTTKDLKALAARFGVGGEPPAVPPASPSAHGEHGTPVIPETNIGGIGLGGGEAEGAFHGRAAPGTTVRSEPARRRRARSRTRSAGWPPTSRRAEAGRPPASTSGAT